MSIVTDIVRSEQVIPLDNPISPKSDTITLKNIPSAAQESPPV